MPMVSRVCDRGKKLALEKAEFFTCCKAEKALKILEILAYQTAKNLPFGIG